jgi:hypothetical protein
MAMGVPTHEAALPDLPPRRQRLAPFVTPAGDVLLPRPPRTGRTTVCPSWAFHPQSCAVYQVEIVPLAIVRARLQEKNSPRVTKRVTGLTIFPASKEQHPMRNPLIAASPGRGLRPRLAIACYPRSLTDAKRISGLLDNAIRGGKTLLPGRTADARIIGVAIYQTALPDEERIRQRLEHLPAPRARE